MGGVEWNGMEWNNCSGQVGIYVCLSMIDNPPFGRYCTRNLSILCWVEYMSCIGALDKGGNYVSLHIEMR